MALPDSFWEDDPEPTVRVSLIQYAKKPPRFSSWGSALDCTEVSMVQMPAWSHKAAAESDLVYSVVASDTDLILVTPVKVKRNGPTMKMEKNK